MRATIDIDIGGTFTDCFITADGKITLTKTPTTGHNLSVGFMRAIREGAERLGLGLPDLLKETDIIRYSTTVAMNKLIERKGPRLGLITTEGFEDTIFIGKGSQWADGMTVKEQRNLARISRPSPLIPRELTVGAKERVDSSGNIARPLNEQDVLQKVQYLVDRGVRGFVVSLLWSFANPTHEQRIREIIRQEYPEVYLGSMPVLLSSDVSPKRFEYTRTMTTVLNTYLHQTMEEELAGMGDELRDFGYRRPIMMIHNTGGMAEVYRTAAVDTYNGGPVAGLMGGAYLGKVYGFRNVVVTDMGGTSFDLGLVVEGSTRFYQFNPVVDRWLVDRTILDTHSIGAGGGSIARVNPFLANRLEVGPESAGSMPGPAAYDQGGRECTVTDADVVLGYINPDYFHGGRMRLSKERAARAIRERVARPLGVEVEAAAYLIKKIVDANMGNEILRQTVLKGYDPREYMLFAYGGAGPTHCCGYGAHVGAQKIVTFPYSPVFCAFGSATMDVVHIYERSKRIPLVKPVTREYFTDYEEFNGVVRSLQEKAARDIRSEGFADEEVLLSLELDMRYGGQLNIKRTISPKLFLSSPEDAEAVYEAFAREYSQAYSPLGLFPEGGVDIENFVLRATIPRPKHEFPTFAARGPDPSRALKGKREAFWEMARGFQPTNVYDQSLLECGNIIEGPAIIEAEDTTIVLPPGKTYTIDRYLNGVIEDGR